MALLLLYFKFLFNDVLIYHFYKNITILNMHIQRIVGPNDCTTMVAAILNPFHIIFLNLCYHDYFCIGLATHCATPCVLQIVNIFQHWVLNHGTVLNTARFSDICVSWGEIRIDKIQFF